MNLTNWIFIIDCHNINLVGVCSNLDHSVQNLNHQAITLNVQKSIPVKNTSKREDTFNSYSVSQ